MKALSFIFVVTALIGCRGIQLGPHASQFQRAVELNISGKSQKSLQIFKKLCNHKHKASCLLSGQEVSWHPQLSIMQGATGAEKTTFVYLRKKRDEFQGLLVDKKNLKIIKPVALKEFSKTFSKWVVVQVSYDKLNLSNDYIFALVSSFGELSDFRNVKTLEPKKKILRWALASCMMSGFSEQKKQWQDLVSHKVDTVFMIGDNVYVDQYLKNKVLGASPESLWQRYVDARNEFEIFRVKDLVPVFATWDDHDYGIGDGDRTFKFKEDAKETFEAFFSAGLSDVLVSKGPGVSKAVRLSGQLFLFLDDRSYRSPKGGRGQEDHFGKIQRDWLIEQIQKAKKPTWLISGDQFFGAYHRFDSFQGSHPKGFLKFLKQLKDLKEKVIFVSGDRHLSELMKIPQSYLGYKTFELTSSGIHAKTFKGSLKKAPNPNGIVGVDGVLNYMIIDSEIKVDGLEAKIKSFGTNKQILFKKIIKIK